MAYIGLNPSYPEGGGRNHHPLAENRDFSGPKPPLDLRPVYKFRFGPVENPSSALSFLVKSWQPDKVREHLFPNSEKEIFDKIPEFCQAQF